MSTPADERSLWVFGYGSLVWKVNFKHGQTAVGSVPGAIISIERLVSQDKMLIALQASPAASSRDQQTTEASLVLIPSQCAADRRHLTRRCPHRGAPGRVVTLVEDASSRTYGVAYEVLPEGDRNCGKERNGFVCCFAVCSSCAVCRPR